MDHFESTRGLRALPMAGAILLALGARAGPLDPPAGPVASSHKTLTEVEPRIAINTTNTPGSTTYVYGIDQPGSYYLTENLVGVSGKAGIRVNVSGVTIDLNGFALQGVSGSLDGITGHPAGVVNAAVVNGSVEFWDGDGIDLATSSGNIRIERVSVRHCAGRGIAIVLNSSARGCAVFSCGLDGIWADDGTAISHCTVRACDGDGFEISESCVVSNCAALENGVNGFVAFNECSLTTCAASGNGSSGFSCLGAASISQCLSTKNGVAGFVVGVGCEISHCAASNNSGDGFNGTNSAFFACTSSSNGGQGFYIAQYSSLRASFAVANDSHGVRMWTDCTVEGNRITGNGAGSPVAAAIQAFGIDNAILDNQCSDADVGIEVLSTGSIIARNVCTGNTLNWNIAANNVVGTTVVGPLSAAVVGDSGGSGVGSTNPWANITY